MSILIDESTRVVVQGLTGREGSFHASQMAAYGTRVVAGVTPGKYGQQVEGVPVFNAVHDAVRSTGANASIIFVPAPMAADAIMEAAAEDLGVCVCITDGVPALDMVKVAAFLRGRTTRLIGPNCPGLISPGKSKLGIMPGPIHKKGPIGVVSRSGTLTYEVVDQLTKVGLGQSSCVGIGGDPIIGSNFIDILTLFQADPETRGVVMIGEIGGSAEEEAAHFIEANMTKPVLAFIAGQTAPPGKRMGHAGAIISGGKGTAKEKMEALNAHGIPVVRNLAELGDMAKEVFWGQGGIAVSSDLRKEES
ncbi:MAG: succinate--CoA ligase subunit alpha [Pseudomonadota bacterium]